MKRFLQHGTVLLVVVGALLATTAYRRHSGTKLAPSVDTLYLLLPDSANLDDPLVQEWIDAAHEEGLHLDIVRDSKFLDPMSQFHAAGLIVPDLIHRTANDTMVGALHSYVRDGGKLMLVYDACTWDLNGYFPQYGSRLSDLAGVEYALYSEYRRNTMAQSRIWGTAATMDELNIPPGKYVPVSGSNEMEKWKEAAKGEVLAKDKANSLDRYTLVRYRYGDLLYPSFRTIGTFKGEVLLQSSAGLAAGVSEHGSGRVLFVNMPLAYLESRTDGLLLHSFLRYFAVNVLHLPTLASVPDGTGGIILNWHIDAESALKPMAVLQKAGIFDNSLTSIHFTAGPDVNVFDDGKGLDLAHNPEAQKWIRYFLQHGNAVGSHGGWIHKYFGENITDTNGPDFEKYLDMNESAIAGVTGQRVREYSAPVGNHPEWVTHWLEKRGYLGYYFSGDSGMGPTRVYRDKGPEGTTIWGFPILHLGPNASMEEMLDDQVPQNTVRAWLDSIADYTANKHVARLVYSHPLGATRYVAALQEWMRHTGELSRHGQFRWYTMTSLAEFLNQRRLVEWTLTPSGKTTLLRATHPQSLVHQSWEFPKSQYGKPHVVQGKADVRDQGDVWMVIAKDCTKLAAEVGRP